LGDCLLWVAVLQIAEIAQIIGLLISAVKVMYVAWAWATLWANFSQTHPVTLI
jgi:hypothetical protein